MATNNNSCYRQIDCPICGKTVVLPIWTDLDHYAYKIRNGKKGGYRKVCSYSCMLKGQKNKAAAKSNNQNKEI